MDRDRTNSRLDIEILRGARPLPMTKREFAEHAIRTAIHNGKYQPGQVISQKRLIEDLHLSLTPLREAVIKLGANGIVERHTHHSIKIPEINKTNLTQIYQVRALLELEAMRLAVRNATRPLIDDLKEINGQLHALMGRQEIEIIDKLDRSFHNVLFNASNNQPLVDAIEFSKRTFSSYGLWATHGRVAAAVADHDGIIAAVDARDLHMAVLLHTDHLQKGLAAALTQTTATTTIEA